MPTRHPYTEPPDPESITLESVSVIDDHPAEVPLLWPVWAVIRVVSGARG
jgi:hypothetical protein